MPRSSRHKSHKQSKHTSRDAREPSDSEEDEKTRDGSSKDECLVRVPRDAASGEKRKQCLDKELSVHGNGDASEDYVVSKRRKEKPSVSASSDRRSDWGDEQDGGQRVEKEMKGEYSKAVGDSKSKSGRRHAGVSEEKDYNVCLVVEKEESKSRGRGDSKRKSEKDFGRKQVQPYKDWKESKDKQRGSDRDRERENQDTRRETEAVESGTYRKQSSHSVDIGEERHGKRGRGKTEGLMQDDLCNPELEKELEKRMRRRKDGSIDKDKYQEDIKDSEDIPLSLRSNHAKYGRYKDQKLKEHEGDGRDNRQRDDAERVGRHRGVKYREDGERDDRHWDDEYHEDIERHLRQRDDKGCKDGERDNRRRDDKYQKDGDRGYRGRDGKFREDFARNNRHKDDKYHADRDRDYRHKDDKYHEDSDRDDMRKDGNRDSKNREDLGRDSKHREQKQRDDGDNERSSKDHSDKSDISHLRDESNDAELYHRKSKHFDLNPTFDDKGRRRTVDKDEQGDSRYWSAKEKHASKDHFRSFKQEESKFRDYAHEDKARNSSGKEYASVSVVTGKASQCLSTDYPLKKDDGHLGELSYERHLKSDAHSSPLQAVDNSPLSIGHRPLNRWDVRQSLDIEDSAQGSCGSKGVKDYSGRKDGGSRELPSETFAGDEASQAHGDNLSVSLPFKDENRCKSNSCHWRTSDPNMGRVEGSAWREVPNWVSPVANGFMPFQHGPPPIGFHPVMQQFPAPPVFGVRPSMELNQSGAPYHIPDGDRFSGHGRPLGWRNPVDESCPPPNHGCEANNAVLGMDLMSMGELIWTMRGGDLQKDQKVVANAEFPYAPKKEDHSTPGPGELWSGPSDLQSQNDKKQPSVPESIGIDQLADDLEKDTLGVLETSKTIPEEVANISRKHDRHLSHVYLTMLDISTDLTKPELYRQFSNLMDMDQKTNLEEDDSKFLLVEEAIDAPLKVSNKISTPSHFSTINDSIFQKAMSLYNKLREVRGIKGDIGAASNVVNLVSAIRFDQKKVGSNDDKQEAEGAVLTLNREKVEASPNIAGEKIYKPLPANTHEKVKIELDLIPKQEILDYVVKVKCSFPENVESCDALSPGKTEQVKEASGLNCNSSFSANGGQNVLDAKCGSVPFTVSSEACEAVMPKSYESVSVNLRIHQNPESTH
ncbi:hypothetical protein NMG60_11026944 [Bertholletia excelsa]